jgi:hypothetical protein
LEIEQAFKNRSWFPGEDGNPLDVALHKMDRVQNLHPLIFGGILVLLACVGGWFSPAAALCLGIFLFNDWLLLALLPCFWPV